MKIETLHKSLFENQDPFDEPQLPARSSQAEIDYLKSKESLFDSQRREYQATIQRILDTECSHALEHNYTVIDANPSRYTEIGYEHVETNKVPPATIEKLLKLVEKKRLISRKIAQVQAKIKSVNKVLKKELMDQNQPDANVKQIPEKSVPKTVDVRGNGKGGVANPYFMSKVGRYAGDPAGYAFGTWMTPIYVKFRDALARNGLGPFTVMYASNVPMRDKTFYSNFIVIGADGRFVWRKYGTSPGAGMNWVYVDGQQLQTSKLTNMSTPNLDKFFAALKSPRK